MSRVSVVRRSTPEVYHPRAMLGSPRAGPRRTCHVCVNRVARCGDRGVVSPDPAAAPGHLLESADAVEIC
eukprot:7389459-Prymnesium_polylepis.1